MNNSPAYITFFHYSEFYSEEFIKGRAGKLLEIGRAYNRPAFFWFSDRYFSHNGNRKVQYLYFFVKNPLKDNIELRARHDGLDFNALYKAFLEYKDELNTYQYAQPPIICSFSTLIPDLILELEDDSSNAYVIVKPDLAKGTKINIFNDDGTPRIFTEIPELVELLPHLKSSLPFEQPMQQGGEYIYTNWNPMITEKMGVWI